MFKFDRTKVLSSYELYFPPPYKTYALSVSLDVPLYS